MTLKKRIVGFLLLLGIVLVIIPVFFGHSIPVDELKLSGRVPAAPTKPKDIEMPIPPQAATIPEKIPSLQTAPTAPVSSETATSAAPAVVRPVAALAAPTPSVEQPAPLPVPAQTHLQQNTAPAENTALAEEASIPLAVPVSIPPPPPVPASSVAMQAPSSDVHVSASSSLKKQKMQAVLLKSPAVHTKNIALTSPVAEKKSKSSSKSVSKNTLSATIAAAQEKWVVQLGTFAQKPNAENLTKKLKSQSLVAYMQPIKTKSGGYATKVFVGPYPDRNDAAQLRTRIQKELNIEGILVKTGSHS